MHLRPLLIVFLLAGAGPLAAATVTADAPPPGRVMILGMFHFANPGKDVVKSEIADVMTPSNQAYLERLTERLASFRPTDVLIECDLAEQAAYDRTYRDYLAEHFVLTANETYQIGFRVARAAGVERVTCFNEAAIQWDAEPMFAYLPKNEPALQAELDSTFAKMSERTGREQATLSLAALLRLANDSARDRENKDLYLVTNGAGAGASFVGADAAASWWHRNFRMYANVQRAAAPGHRVLVMAGQGHTAILKDLLAIDTRRVADSVESYLFEP